VSKIHFLDSGLLTALRYLSAARIKADRMAFGAVLDDPPEFFHFRDRYGHEGDVVLEDSDTMSGSG
jgi:uncharacterized protein